MGDYEKGRAVAVISSKVKQASELFEVEGLPLRVLTLDALIQTKQALNRPRDRETLR